MLKFDRLKLINQIHENAKIIFSCNFAAYGPIYFTCSNSDAGMLVVPRTANFLVLNMKMVNCNI